MPGTTIWVGNMGGSKGWGQIGEAFGRGMGDQYAKEKFDPEYMGKMARERAIQEIIAGGKPRAQSEAQFADDAMGAYEKAKIAAEQFNLHRGQTMLPGEVSLQGAQVANLGATTADTQSQTTVRNTMLPAQLSDLQSTTTARNTMLPAQLAEVQSQTSERDQLLPWKIADYPHKWAADMAQVESSRLYYSQKAQQENDLEFLKLMVTSGDRNTKLMSELQSRLSKPGIRPEEVTTARVDTALAGIQGTLQMIQGLQASPGIAGKVDPRFVEADLGSNISMLVETVTSQKTPEKQAAVLRQVTSSMKPYRESNPAVWQRFLKQVADMSPTKTEKGFFGSLTGDAGFGAITGQRDQQIAFDPLAQIDSQLTPQPMQQGLAPTQFNGMYQYNSPDARAQALQRLSGGR